MTTAAHAYPLRGIDTLHAILLAGTIPLFLGALLSDITYARSFQIQWSNFASWLLAGGLLFAGLALLWAIVDLVRAEQKGGRRALYTVLLLVTWVIGFFNALHHARDAWAIMPTAVVLSVIVLVLACITTWIGFMLPRAGGAQ